MVPHCLWRTPIWCATNVHGNFFRGQAHHDSWRTQMRVCHRLPPYSWPAVGACHGWGPPCSWRTVLACATDKLEFVAHIFSVCHE